MKSTLSSLTSFRWASSWFEVYAAVSTFIMLLRTAINDLVPDQVRSFIASKIEAFFSNRQANNMVSLKINRFWDENSGQNNELYLAAYEYLPTRITRTCKSLKLGKLDGHKNLVLAVDGSEEVEDQFEGIKFTWKLDDGSEKEPTDFKKLAFKLSYNEKHKEIVMDKYIPHVLQTYEAMKLERRILKIHSWAGSYWGETELSHPATFDTLALDPELKQSIIDDLERFLKRKEMYKKVGKPWKRGYLLYGPPGTGKSSLIAAMANYLKFDVYDLDLNSVYSNSYLMHAMGDTSRRSIIVIEDIDCNNEVQARSPPPFLKAKAFRILASNYLDIQDHHPLFEQIEELLEKIEVTPAVAAEQLIRSEDPEVALGELLKFLDLLASMFNLILCVSTFKSNAIRSFLSRVASARYQSSSHE